MVIHGSVMLQCPSLQTKLQQLPPADNAFCNGGSVTLTANQGSSYFDPGGQTTFHQCDKFGIIYS